MNDTTDTRYVFMFTHSSIIHHGGLPGVAVYLFGNKCGAKCVGVGLVHLASLLPSQLQTDSAAGTHKLSVHTLKQASQLS